MCVLVEKGAACLALKFCLFEDMYGYNLGRLSTVVCVFEDVSLYNLGWISTFARFPVWLG